MIANTFMQDDAMISPRSPWTRYGVCAVMVLAGSAMTGGALAQAMPPAPAWPLKPVHLTVGFAAGGPTDVVARSFADFAGKALGQPMVVDNKPGANATLAAQAVASAAGDGHTLLLAATNHAMIPALYGNRVKFDALKSFKPICTLASAPTVLVVGPSLTSKTLGDFLAQAKAKPRSVTYATAGPGSSGHFYSEQFARLTGISMTHIPYKGAAPAVVDLMSGQVDASFATLGSVLPQILSGKLRALAISSAQRSSHLPQVPTFEEAGVKSYDADAWYGLLAPASVPPAVQKALEQEAVRFGKSPQQADKLRALGMEAQVVCSDRFASQMAREVALYADIARDLNLTAD